MMKPRASTVHEALRYSRSIRRLQCPTLPNAAATSFLRFDIALGLHDFTSNTFDDGRCTYAGERLVTFNFSSSFRSKQDSELDAQPARASQELRAKLQ